MIEAFRFTPTTLHRAKSQKAGRKNVFHVARRSVWSFVTTSSVEWERGCQTSVQLVREEMRMEFIQALQGLDTHWHGTERSFNSSKSGQGPKYFTFSSFTSKSLILGVKIPACRRYSVKLPASVQLRQLGIVITGSASRMGQAMVFVRPAYTVCNAVSSYMMKNSDLVF
jgi:hypothetical protein